MEANMATVPGITTVTQEHKSSYMKNYGAFQRGNSKTDVIDYYNQWTTYNQVCI